MQIFQFAKYWNLFEYYEQLIINVAHPVTLLCYVGVSLQWWINTVYLLGEDLVLHRLVFSSVLKTQIALTFCLFSPGRSEEEQGGGQKTQVLRVGERGDDRKCVSRAAWEEEEEEKTLQLQLPDCRAELQGGANVQRNLLVNIIKK